MQSKSDPPCGLAAPVETLFDEAKCIPCISWNFGLFGVLNSWNFMCGVSSFSITDSFGVKTKQDSSFLFSSVRKKDSFSGRKGDNDYSSFFYSEFLNTCRIWRTLTFGLNILNSFRWGSEILSMEIPSLNLLFDLDRYLELLRGLSYGLRSNLTVLLLATSLSLV